MVRVVSKRWCWVGRHRRVAKFCRAGAPLSQALFEEGPPTISTQTGLPWKCGAPPSEPPTGGACEQSLQATGSHTGALHTEVRRKCFGHVNLAKHRNQIVELDVTRGLGTPNGHDNMPQKERLRKGAGEWPRMLERGDAEGSCRVDVANARERHNRNPSKCPCNRGRGRLSGHKRPRRQGGAEAAEHGVRAVHSGAVRSQVMSV